MGPHTCASIYIKAVSPRFDLCFDPDPLPVEAKPAWHKQAVQLEEEELQEEQEEVVLSEEPT